MGLFNNVGGAWKNVTSIFVNVAGTWKNVISGFVNVAGTWKQFFSSTVNIDSPVTISKSTDPTTYLTTLVGTNYHWTPNPTSLTYYFEHSTNGGVTWDSPEMSSGTATNPSVGSSNTYNFFLTATGTPVYVTPNVLNYYRFRVYASLGSANSTSSATTTIQGPTNITNLSISSQTSSSANLSWSASTGANRYMVYYSSNGSTFSLYAGTTLTNVSVTGLSIGTTYYFKVLPVTGFSNTYTGYSGNYSNTVSASIVGDALTPSLTLGSLTSDGFYFSIDNYDSNYSWAVSVSLGSVSLYSGTTYKVSGLSAGQYSTATVTTTRSGYSSGQNTVTGHANNAAISITLSSTTSTADGYTFTLTSSYDAAWNWSASVGAGSFGSTASILPATGSSSSQTYTVSGLSASESATSFVVATRSGYESGSASVLGSASAASVSLSLANSGTYGFSATFSSSYAVNQWQGSATLTNTSGVEVGTITSSNITSPWSPTLSSTYQTYGTWSVTIKALDASSNILGQATSSITRSAATPPPPTPTPTPPTPTPPTPTPPTPTPPTPPTPPPPPPPPPPCHRTCPDGTIVGCLASCPA